MYTSSSHLISAAILFCIILTGCHENAASLVIRNTGTALVEVTPSDEGGPVGLGRDGTMTLDAGKTVAVGDATISLSDRIEIANVGTDALTVNYTDSTGAQKTMLLGEGGTGFFNGSTPVLLGDLEIGVSSVK